MKHLLLAVLACLLVAGCGTRSEEKPEAAVAEAPEAAAVPEQSIMDRARELYFQNDREGALALVEQGLADPLSADEYTALFRSMLELLLIMDRTEDAQQRFLGILGVNDAVATVSYGMIESKLQDEGELLLAWLDQLQAQPKLPAALRDRVFGDRVLTLARLGRSGNVLALVPEAVERFGAAGMLPLFKNPFSVLLGNGDLDAAGRLLDGVEAAAAGVGETAGFVLAGRLSILAERGDWETLTQQMEARGAELGDAALRQVLRGAVDRADAAGRRDVSERLARYVLTSCGQAEGSCRAAVGVLVDHAMLAGGIDAVVTTLSDLRRDGIPLAYLEQPVNQHFYDTMQKGGAEAREAMLQLVEALLASLPASDRKIEQFRGLLMDGAVMNDDYRRALAVLEGGFRADDKDWHAMALNKVRAHLALVEGRPEEAVRRFRAFMDHVATWTTPTTDPSTGLRHTREMSLGFNGKRIADILASMNEAEEAAKMYAEARRHYEAALAEFKETDKEYAYIQEQLSSLP
jgi:tetratricopeptide (TPR) repeat protein